MRGPVCQLVLDDLSSETVQLEGVEARHALTSLRARPGESFLATDGRGTRARLVIERLGRRTAEASVVDRSWGEPPERRWWLATGAQEGRLDWVVEKAVELGAWGVIPLAMRRPGRGGAGDSRRHERWERLARAALGQCLGAWGLTIGSEAGVRELLAAGPGGGRRWSRVIWADPGGVPALRVAAEQVPAGDLALLVGPPEGFAPMDRTALEAVAGGLAIRLAERRLRSETAAVAALAWAALLGDEGVKSGRKGPGWG